MVRVPSDSKIVCEGWNPARVSSKNRGRSRLAGDALQPLANHAGPAVVGENPRTHLPRRVVAHVLGVAALQVGHPVILGVLVKTDDLPLHCASR